VDFPLLEAGAVEAGVLEDVAPGAGLDDSGPEDAGLDDSVLEDAGLDDPGLDDSGLDDPAALVDGMLDDVTVETALDEVADAVLEAAGAVAAVELLEATPFELELHAVSSAQAAARATRPFVLFIRVPFSSRSGSIPGTTQLDHYRAAIRVLPARRGFAC